MSRSSWLYLMVILGLGIGLGVLSLTGRAPTLGDWEALVALMAFATGSQLFKALFKSNQQSDRATTSYSPILIFLFAGALILPPALFVLLAAVPHLVEWGKERIEKSKNLAQWYVQSFNIAAHIICGLTAQQVFFWASNSALTVHAPRELLGAAAAVFVYVALNHLMVGLALVLARGVTWQAAGVLEFENVLPDLIMLSLGFAVALLWGLNPWFILPALSPLVLIQRALMVPQLKKEARIDSKTGLWNARHFAELFTAEFKRARRFDRPMSLIMADLDLLRNINNTYGHLAGDNVLEGLGEIIRSSVREYDIPSRFGGEEFLIAMPESGPLEAFALAERLRKKVESTEFHGRTTATPVRATISLGISNFPSDATTTSELIHAADVAVYQAKLNGRNCVILSADVPRSLDLDSAIARERLESPQVDAFIPRPAELMAPGRRATEDRGTPVEPPHEARRRPERAGLSADKTERRKVKPAGASRPQKGSRIRDRIGLYLYLGTVIGLGTLVTALALTSGGPSDWTPIILFALFAAIGEYLQIDAAENTISVSVAVNAAAALGGGPLGLVITSGVIAIIHRLLHPAPARVALYKTAFNWSNHILAGVAPLLVLRVFGVSLGASSLPSLVVPIILGGLLYYAVETGLLASVISLTERSSVVTVWQGNFGWLAVHYLAFVMMGLLMSVAYATLGVIGLLVFSLPPLMMRYAIAQYVEHSRSSLSELKRLNQQLTRANSEVVRASHSILQMNDELLLTLAKIIDARDPYVSDHSSRVARSATAIASELGLSPERVEQVRQAALFHDIGKIGIPEAILHKPAQLNPEEYERIKTHVVLGAEFLETCQGLRNLAPFVRHHHEWWDGNGYPDHLHREQIPLEARILSVCDAVEAMASDRPYHRAMSLPEIIMELIRCAGTQFDPVVVQTLVHILEREGDRLVVNSAREVVKKNGHITYPVGPPPEWVLPPEYESPLAESGTESGPPDTPLFPPISIKPS